MEHKGGFAPNEEACPRGAEALPQMPRPVQMCPHPTRSKHSVRTNVDLGGGGSTEGMGSGDVAKVVHR